MSALLQSGADIFTSDPPRAAIAAILLPASVAGIYLAWRQVLRPWMETTPPSLVAATSAAVWVVTVAVLYIWRRLSLHRARSAHRETLARLADATRTQFDGLIAQTIGLAAVTLEWAVRAEMVRDDLEDVQEYMQQLVKRPRVRRALVANADGGVIAASDPDSRGRKLEETIENPPPEASAVQVLPRADGVLRLVIPIMGLEARLGTLIVEYEQPVLLAAAAS